VSLRCVTPFLWKHSGWLVLHKITSVCPMFLWNHEK
jgi:hypothetical protein